MTLLEAAQLYATWGWPVLPCHWIEGGLCSCGDPECRSAGKHPYQKLVPRGLHQATLDPMVVNAWWAEVPNANVAIRTGGELLVLDVDNKPGKDGAETLREWEKANGALPATIEALTGGGGHHLYFRVPAGVVVPSGVDVLGPGVDVRCEGGYVLAPTSNHASGRTYEWEASNDPTDPSITPVWAELPPNLTAALLVRAPKPGPASAATERLTAAQVKEIRSALTCIPKFDDRDTWVQVGMALESTRAGEQAYGLWTEWSQQSEKYDAKDQRRVWRSFKPDHGVTLSSLFWMAQGNGWVDPLSVQEAQGSTIEVRGAPLPPPKAQMPPAHLLTVPGALGEFVAWSDATAHRYQPQFSVQAALALGSVALGRAWRTDKNNWPALYFLNVGPSGCGKEHAKACVERVLHAAGHLELLNGSGYTSRGAVFSSLLVRPVHLTMVDEFGLFLESTRKQGNSHRADVVADLMEAFGRCSGPWAPVAYSTMGKSNKERAESKVEPVWCPSITLVGLTTPRTFYGALDSTSIKGGFLNRLLVVESSVGRTPARDAPQLDPPEGLVEWVQRVRAPAGNLPVANIASLEPSPRVVPFTADAAAMAKDMDADIMAWQEREAQGSLDDLLVRAREIAMRLALIVAVSCDPKQPTLKGEHFGWARDYVMHYLHQTLAAVRLHVADSKFEATKQTILRGLQERGANGATRRDMNRYAPFTRFQERERDEALAALQSGGMVQAIDIGGGTQGGRPSVRWVAVG